MSGAGGRAGNGGLSGAGGAAAGAGTGGAGGIAPGTGGGAGAMGGATGAGGSTGGVCGVASDGGVKQIVAGGNHTCILTTTGGVRCWGYNMSGQLGDGTTTNRTTPPTTDVLTGVQAIAAGNAHTCALTTTGGVRCWGENGGGQLGDGTTTNRSTPPATDVLTGVQAIAAGEGDTCALTTTGGVRCWGSGPLGDGTTTNRTTPPATDVLTGVQAIAMGFDHICALTNAGGVRCWGDNSGGALGDGTPTSRSTPPTTDVLAGVQAIAAGFEYTCALMIYSGGVRCWGDNISGQFGDGTTSGRTLTPPTTDVLAGVQAIATGNEHTCALMTTGGVRCWGAKNWGQLGDGTTADRSTPPTTDVLAGVQAIAAGNEHTCALTTTGGIRCWGDNGAGALGDGTTTSSPIPVEVQLCPGTSGTAGAGGTTGTGGMGGMGGTGGGRGPYVYFVKQMNGTTTATLAGGVFTLSSDYPSSGSAFEYVAPNYYGSVSNGFISFPTPMTGDFSIAADVTITSQRKADSACGIGLGITTGWAGTDSYSYILMRNQNNSTNGYYVSGSGAIESNQPYVPFTNGKPLHLTFSRTGSQVSYGAGPVGGTMYLSGPGSLTNGTTVYGLGPVYATISFNNVEATVTNLKIKDATYDTVYDSATGGIVTYIPASLTLSSTSVSLAKGASGSVTATAIGVGGAVSLVSAVSTDPTIATVSVASGATNSITIDGLRGGVTMVTVTNTGDSNAATNSKTILVAVNDYETADPYGSMATLAYPAPGATNAYADGELALTFDAPPTLNTGGTIHIYALADGSEVDSIGFAGETQVIAGTTINVGSQLVRVSGNEVLFTPHIGKVAYGTAYYIGIPTTSITGTLTGMPFNGLSNLSTVATWKFTTRAAPTLSATGVTVDGSQNSTANFRTLQGALGGLAAGLPGASAVTINMAAGTYSELVHYVGPSATQTITILGPAGNNRGDNCVVQYTNGTGMNDSAATRASAYFSGVNLVLQNITLKNTGVRSVVSQAEALDFAGGSVYTLAAFNSSFSSNQNTIQTSGRSWFYDCYVEGNVDFIWGTADAALLENCSLRFINDLGGGAAYDSLFVARTGTALAMGGDGTVPKGYVLLNSTVSVDANVTAYFGRDTGTGPYYDQAALVNVVFDGAGTIGSGVWNIYGGSTDPPLSLGDSSYVGWKSAGCAGLNLSSLMPHPWTSATIASQATEYDTRDHILNRVVTVTAGAPSGFQAATTTWDVSALATAWGAP